MSTGSKFKCLVTTDSAPGAGACSQPDSTPGDWPQSQACKEHVKRTVVRGRQGVGRKSLDAGRACAALGHLLNFSMTDFIFLKNRNNTTTYLPGGFCED